MAKVWIRYLMFWLPAFAVEMFYVNDTIPSLVLQWFTAFLMVLSWAINTGSFAAQAPRSALAFLLAFGGGHIVLINAVYRTFGPLQRVLRTVGGIFTYKPLDIFVRTLKPYGSLPHEQIVILVLLSACLLGFLIGLVQRRVNPNPYTPRMMRRRGG